MVSTISTTPKAVSGHRRSRSQTSACSKSPIWTGDEPRYTLKARAQRAHSLLSYSDPVDSDLYASSSLFSLYSGRIKGREDSRPRRSQKRPRHALAYAGRKESLRVSQPRNGATLISPSTPFALAHAPAMSTPLRLPSTPNAFHLSSSAGRIAQPQRLKRETSPVHQRQIRSEYQDAFGQLRRSLEDGDERFILRMQEWEQQNAAPRIETDTPTESTTINDLGFSKQLPDELQFDDDDVEIVVHGDASPCMLSAELQGTDSFLDPSSHLHHKISYDSFMEEDLALDDSVSLSQYSATSFSNGFPSSTSMGGPSTSSSMISLSSPIDDGAIQLQSKSDRAIAALTLALANGAAGLEDYHSILQAQEDLPECDAGSYWD